MKQIIHRANDRGIQDHGWLKAAHSFSFANYHDPSKAHFGMLRVLNDDVIAPGMGFGTHAHDNMEIVTIPLKGVLSHKDSLGSEGNITYGEVQVMSAGTGIRHSEFNGSSTEEVNLLQLWVFPKQRNIQPRYDQMRYKLDEANNSFLTVVSPDQSENVMWINQDAYFSLGTFDAGKSANYRIQYPGNGAYVFLIDGQAELSETTLNKRDAMGIYETENIEFKFNRDSKVLIVEVPMQ
ncbi:MAG: pirin family protein [Bacteroidetes bacterium]|nr:pirin family protein [Bacteroidota bacterium]